MLLQFRQQDCRRQGIRARGAAREKRAWGKRAKAQAAPSDAREKPELRAALSGRMLLLRYQPIIRLRNGHIAALEGLVRWPRQEALLHAGAFVPLAEKLGLALDLTHAVLERVAHDWQQMPSPKGGLAVNMPLSVLMLPEMPARLAATLRQHGKRRGPLLLELTETEAIRDPSRLRQVMMRLKRLGISVLLDDVTLGDHRWRLTGLPFAGVKLDRSLIEALPNQMRARHFLRRILTDSQGPLCDRRGRCKPATPPHHPRPWRGFRPRLFAWPARAAATEPRRPNAPQPCQARR
jgi:EAL domain-containing protein (putative c-di-GMP-specific phosphodiesterase class I)